MGYMIHKIEYILFPENCVRIAMKSEDFDKFLNDCFDEFDVIYEHKGNRILILDNNSTIVEEVK